MAENKLELQHQIFIVNQLAMFQRPSSVREALKLQFEIEISLPGILHYDISNPDLLKKWKALFNSTRKKFLENSSRIPISNKSYRLSKLQQMFEAQENESPRLQNKKAMRAILEQSAKESGDVFTNRSYVQVSDPKGEPPRITVEVVKSSSIIKDEPEQ